MVLREKEELVVRISELVRRLKPKEKKTIFERILSEDKPGIPISVFKAKLSALAIIIKYFRENKKK